MLECGEKRTCAEERRQAENGVGGGRGSVIELDTQNLASRSAPWITASREQPIPRGGLHQLRMSSLPRLRLREHGSIALDLLDMIGLLT